MKIPEGSLPDLLEYKIDYTPDLRCEKRTDLVPVCHSCKSCILSWKIFATQEWFMRASSITQRQFVIGIIKRSRNQDLLKYTWNFLKSVYNKDFICSHSSVPSSFLAPSTMDRALNPQTLKKSMSDLWKWFLNASFWTKANYTLLMLQMCNSQLLFMAASLVRVLLTKDVKISSKSLKIDEGKAKEEPPHVKELQKSGSRGRPRVKRVWSKDSDLSSGDAPESEDENSDWLVSLDVTSWPPSPQKVVICIDFIRCLPIQLSKHIFRMLDSKSLTCCSHVSSHWAFLVKEIRKDMTTHHALQNETLFFQGSCPKGAIPSFAKVVKVAIPQINKAGEIIPVTGPKDKLQPQESVYKESVYMQKGYHSQLTNTVMLEERNVFCSSYNIRSLMGSVDPDRVIHYSGGKLVAFGSGDRKIQFLDVNKVKKVHPILSGHAGRIRAIYFNEQKQLLLSGSFDLSIRMWNTQTGACLKMFNGHRGTIMCLDLHNNTFVSGSRDCTAKMWDIETGKCLRTFKHKGIVWAAKMNDVHVVSSCDRGLVKVWHVETYELIKILEGHLGPVRCLSFDNWHLVTGSNDGYVLGWSMVGKHKRCLTAFRHPM
uniref:Uncharacterized protein n=1 Tax=Sphaerodactylus townsendi TaxID=933632 RepID=A0ACB8EJL8_9SAUR